MSIHDNRSPIYFRDYDLTLYPRWSGLSFCGKNVQDSDAWEGTLDLGVKGWLPARFECETRWDEETQPHTYEHRYRIEYGPQRMASITTEWTECGEYKDAWDDLLDVIADLAPKVNRALESRLLDVAHQRALAEINARAAQETEG